MDTVVATPPLQATNGDVRTGHSSKGRTGRHPKFRPSTRSTIWHQDPKQRSILHFLVRPARSDLDQNSMEQDAMAMEYDPAQHANTTPSPSEGKIGMDGWLGLQDPSSSMEQYKRLLLRGLLA